MLPAKETEPRSKRRIGRYLVTGRIGRGGMGMVYRGRDETLDREVAIKTLTAEGAFDGESRRRFEIEAKAAARLQHPSILTVFELGEDRGLPFIAMELLPGADLEGLIRSGEPMPLREKLEVVVQVLRGLHYAHEHGIVHRDIKPSNIRLLDDGTAKIMDFGIAKLGGTNLTKSGFMVGTVNYMSPEQIRAQELDGRSDVFSVGVILYELLAGQRPFAGEAATDVLYRIAHTEPPPLSAEALGGLGETLQAIVARALCKDPAQRFSSAAAMADSLAEALREHAAAHPVSGALADAEALQTARRLLKEGQFDAAEHHIRTVIGRCPDLLDGRRLSRTLARERARQAGSPEPEGEIFAELDATYQSPATTKQPGTVLQAPPPTIEYQRPEPAGAAPDSVPARRRPFAGAAAALLVAGLAAFLLMRGGDDAPPTAAAPAPAGPNTAPAAPSKPVPAAAAPVLVTIRVVSDPAGATLRLDGRPVPGTTPLDLEIDPGRDHLVRVAKTGFLAAEARVAAGRAAPELRLVLETAGPPGVVALSAAYPVDVAWKGRTLLRAQTAARLELPIGRQTLSLVSEKHFLRSTVVVDVRAGVEAALTAPALGRLSIRALPDNCEVSIDGIFADYPPILDRPVASGTRVVSFKWPDGTRREETVEVRPGVLGYVMGRKD